MCVNVQELQREHKWCLFSEVVFGIRVAEPVFKKNMM